MMIVSCMNTHRKITNCAIIILRGALFFYLLNYESKSKKSINQHKEFYFWKKNKKYYTHVNKWLHSTYNELISRNSQYFYGYMDIQVNEHKCLKTKLCTFEQKLLWTFSHIITKIYITMTISPAVCKYLNPELNKCFKMFCLHKLNWFPLYFIRSNPN